jgi:8-oxo-dGTP pyrophosphatase MutT (NUDIX family)
MSDFKQQDSATPAIGQQVITAVAFIHQVIDGVEKIFLPRRSVGKKFKPGVFEVPGGHIDFGENMVAGLKREIKEELGIAITVGDPFAVFTYINEVKQSHAIEVAYYATFAGDPHSICLDPEEHSEYVWLSEEELPRAYTADKLADDEEFVAVRHGFALLNGRSAPDFVGR